MRSTPVIAFHFVWAGSAGVGNVLACDPPLRCVAPSESELSRRMLGASPRVRLEMIQSRVVFDIAAQAFGAARGCEIERAVLGRGYTEDTRERWWDRLRYGQLRIRPALKRGDHTALRWMSCLRERTRLADEALDCPLWRLAGGEPMDIEIVAGCAYALGRLGLKCPRACDGSGSDAERLRKEVQAMLAKHDYLLALAGALYCFQLGRAIGDPLTHALAFSEWADYVQRFAKRWLRAPAAEDITAFVASQFTWLKLTGTQQDEIRRVARDMKKAGVEVVHLRVAHS